MKSKNNRHLSLIAVIVLAIAALVFVDVKFLNSRVGNISQTKNGNVAMSVTRPANATPSPAPTTTPQPTAIPLTFDQMNKLYGPCARVPVLFYHHVADPAAAKAGNFTGLNVTTSAFAAHMQYLKDRGYTTINISDIANFFDTGAGLPAKSVVITLDDGYNDFATNAFPLLQQYGFKATMFLPTGLVGNPGYLNWGQVSDEAASGLVYFANHSWSHRSMAISQAVADYEISTADMQLSERGLNPGKVFAYPYGTIGSYAKNILANKGYRLAFTTIPGSTLCAKQRLNLPRVRIGNASLGAYGF